MSLLSLITVTRNNLEGLRRTHASLAEQSFQGFEWLVIDGASDDGTVEFLQSAEADYVSEPDAGIYDAMNKGIARANGFYLLFLNAGDALAAPDTLAELAAYIQDLQVTPDFIYGDSLEAMASGKPHYKPARPYAKAAQGMFTHHQAMLYRRDLLEDLRYDTNYKIAADYKFTLQFLQRADMVVYAPFPLCLFESGGVSQQNAALGRAEQYAIRRALGTVNPAQNMAIYAAQKTLWTLRKFCPTLYWTLKNREK